jgi:MYXO-CTERM domain-containing protein
MKKTLCAVTIAASCVVGPAVAWACSLGYAWGLYWAPPETFACVDAEEVVPSMDSHGQTFAFENGCADMVSVDVSACEYCECVEDCSEPVALEPDARLEFLAPHGFPEDFVTDTDTEDEVALRCPIVVTRGEDVLEVRFWFDFDYDQEPCDEEHEGGSGGSVGDSRADEGCAVAGAQAPARRAPWGGLVVVLGLWGWRRRRG